MRNHVSATGFAVKSVCRKLLMILSIVQTKKKLMSFHFMTLTIRIMQHKNFTSRAADITFWGRGNINVL